MLDKINTASEIMLRQGVAISTFDFITIMQDIIGLISFKLFTY